MSSDKKTLDRKTYMIVRGLFEVAKQKQKEVCGYELELCKQLNIPKEGWGYAGHLSDGIYDPDSDFEKLFDFAGYVVEE